MSESVNSVGEPAISFTVVDPRVYGLNSVVPSNRRSRYMLSEGGRCGAQGSDTRLAGRIEIDGKSFYSIRIRTFGP